MTVIVYRDGVIAADTAVWLGQVITSYTKKIRRLSDGRLFAAAGGAGTIAACFAWLNDEGERPDAEKDGRFGALVLGSDDLWLYNHRFQSSRESLEGFSIVGAHHELLLGALAMGAPAEVAVRIAIKYGDSAGGEVQVERFTREETKAVAA